MQVEIVAVGNLADRRNRVAGADRGAAGAGDDAGRQQAGSPVGDDRRFECCRVHAVQRPACRDTHEIGLADAGDPDRPVNRRVHLVEA